MMATLSILEGMQIGGDIGVATISIKFRSRGSEEEKAMIRVETTVIGSGGKKVR